MGVFLKLFTVPVIFLAGSLSAAPVGPCVQLTGTVLFETHLGPPNYGQTPGIDQKIIVPFLTIDNKDFWVRDLDDVLHEYKDIKNIQLIGFDDVLKKSGEILTITGCLYEAENIRHFSRIYMYPK